MTGLVLLIIFRSLISLCFITCLIRISLNLKMIRRTNMINGSAIEGIRMSHNDYSE